MSSPIHPRQRCTESLSQFRHSLQQCQGGGRDQLFSARSVLQAFGDELSKSPWSHLDALVQMSQMVLGQLLRRGGLDSVDSMELLGGFCQFIETELSREAPALNVTERQPAETPPSELHLKGVEQPKPAIPTSAFDPLKAINETRLGEVLIGMGLITSMELDRALVLQRVTERRLGDILLEMDLIASPQLDEALQRQRDMTLKLTSKDGKFGGLR